MECTEEMSPAEARTFLLRRIENYRRGVLVCPCALSRESLAVLLALALAELADLDRPIPSSGAGAA